VCAVTQITKQYQIDLVDKSVERGEC